MYTIGYNTVRAYLQKDLFRTIRKRIKLTSIPDNGWLYLHNGAEVYFNFSLYGNTYVDFNVPSLLYGNRLEVADIEGIAEVVKLFTEITTEDFANFNFSNLSIATNLKSLGDVSLYESFLKKPPRFRGQNIESNRISFHNSSSESISGRILVFSNKGDMLRVETSFISQGNNNAKQLINKYLNHNSKISELLKESFYYNSAEYFNSLIKSAFNVKGSANASLAEQTLKDLQDNYVNSFRPKCALSPF